MEGVADERGCRGNEKQTEEGEDGRKSRWKGRRWRTEKMEEGKMEEQMVGGAMVGGKGLRTSCCWSALQVYRATGLHSCLVGEVGFIVYRERHPEC
jgi:hypothetical protein